MVLSYYYPKKKETLISNRSPRYIIEYFFYLILTKVDRSVLFGIKLGADNKINKERLKNLGLSKDRALLIFRKFIDEFFIIDGGSYSKFINYWDFEKFKIF